MPNILDQKRKSSYHVIKTFSIQSKERKLKVAREKDQVTYKSRFTRIKLYFPIRH